MHKPVLLQEFLNHIPAKENLVYVDGTLGYGGHASEVIKKCGNKIIVIGFDKDNIAINEARTKIEKLGIVPVIFNESFDKIKKEITNLNIKPDVIFLDIGISSPQLDVSGRGFTFRYNEPLLMTMKDKIDKDTLTAKEIVNNWGEESLADIIYGYGEERYARRIAREIVVTRKIKEIETTFDLREIILKSVPNIYKKGKIDPATRTFQALRIAVNDELETLKRTLPDALEVLASGGRLIVISFHSLEDRIVKDTFKTFEDEGHGKRITKKPLIEVGDELRNNPRARSAKMRIFEKI